jgi:predicted nucleic-acid-binding Zn-ribbon protein
MVQTKQCPKCSGAMHEGFVLDATHGAMTVSSWVEGAPQKSAWTGVKLSGRARSEISAWRCARCGFLEHYAAAAPDRGFEAAQRKQVMLVLAMVLGVTLVLVGAVVLLRMG